MLCIYLLVFVSLSLLEGDIAIGVISVRLSVRLSHAGIESKLMNIGSCSFY